ncbi:MAG TPA: AAA family ATPase [Mycobacteriales bacterium]|nr:AAA family ATPase [Mycobacteriales bacterium]
MVCASFVLLTGGPGGGKTTLVEHLAGRGYATSAEAGRAIIRDQALVGGPLRADPVAFAETILTWELRAYREASGLTFFDRGVPDVVASYLLLDRPVPDHVLRAAEVCRYAPVAFAAPPWREVYVNDADRTQTWDEAVRTYEACVAAYERCGYELVALPFAPVGERAAFVLGRVSPPSP